MSCSEKEDENKIAILKETQDELIHQCKMQENQLKVKYVGNQSIKIYLTISQKLNSYIFSVLDTTNSNSNLTLDDKKNQKEYFNVLNTERSTYKHNIYFPSDDSVIYNKRFDQLELQNEGRIENKLLSNIYILNTHLKILRLNGSCAALGCNLGVNQLGYGTTTIYDGLDSTKIFAHYTFPWKKAAIKTMKFARLENENGEIVHSINHKNLLDNKMEVSSRKLNKGKYNLTITFEYIIENGDERSEEISFPIEIYK
jgi:hypothetical protein